jgi:hypothetical protein
VGDLERRVADLERELRAKQGHTIASRMAYLEQRVTELQNELRMLRREHSSGSLSSAEPSFLQQLHADAAAEAATAAAAAAADTSAPALRPPSAARAPAAAPAAGSDVHLVVPSVESPPSLFCREGTLESEASQHGPAHQSTPPPPPPPPPNPSVRLAETTLSSEEESMIIMPRRAHRKSQGKGGCCPLQKLLL